jgi:hypothetical protein
MAGTRAFCECFSTHGAHRTHTRTTDAHDMAKRSGEHFKPQAHWTRHGHRAGHGMISQGIRHSSCEPHSLLGMQVPAACSCAAVGEGLACTRAGVAHPGRIVAVIGGGVTVGALGEQSQFASCLGDALEELIEAFVVVKREHEAP